MLEAAKHIYERVGLDAALRPGVWAVILDLRLCVLRHAGALRMAREAIMTRVE